MKWFKHLSGSLSSTFIFDLIRLYGGDGYLIFFGVLELMSDEFDIYQPGFNRFPMKKLQSNFQLSRQKIVKVLKWINQKATENLQKTDEKLVKNWQNSGTFLAFYTQLSNKKSTENVGFFVCFDKNDVSVICLRLKDLCDEYTAKQVLKLSGHYRDTESGVCRDLEAEAEAEAEADMLKELNGVSGLSGEIEGILRGVSAKVALLKKIQNNGNIKNGSFFNPDIFVRDCINISGHPKAVDLALYQLIKNWPGVRYPGKYAKQVFDDENKNFNERESILIHEKLKNEEFKIEGIDIGKMLEKF